MGTFANSMPIVALVLAIAFVAGTPPQGTLESGRLTGVWTCSGSSRENVATETYVPAADGTIAFSNDVRTSTGERAVVSETFAFDAGRGSWHLTAPPTANFGGMSLVAEPWSGAQWIFTGSETVRGAPRPVRIVYTLVGGDELVREHQRALAGTWHADGSYRCHRITPAATTAQSTPDTRSTPVPTPTPIPTPSPSPSPRPIATAMTTPSPRSTALRPLVASATPNAVAVPAITPRAMTRAKPRPPNVALAPAPQRQAIDAGRAPKADRAYALVGGKWSCRNISGDLATHAFTRTGAGAFKLRDELTIAKHIFTIEETYRFDRSTGRWSTVTQGDAYDGVAPPWRTAEWIFDGSVPNGNKRASVRMIYEWLGQNTFARRFERFDGRWKAFTSETCRRH